MDNTESLQTDSVSVIEPAPQDKPKRLPLFCKIIYIISAFCLILYILFICFPTFSDWFNKYISPLIRNPLAKISGVIPFSIAEFLIILSPVIIAATVTYGLKHYGNSWKELGIFCLIMLTLSAYIFSTLTLGFIPAYRGSRLDAKMKIEKNEVSAEELLATSLILSDKIWEDIDEIGFSASGASVMPYGYEELNKKLMDAYDKAAEKYDFISTFQSKFKRVMLSEPMTYTHISGVYTFFTGEANINTNYPDYSLPYTAAHELAHQRGFAREDEANFIAFLVCSEADDAYLRYSAYIGLYEYVAGALSYASYDYYVSSYRSLPENARREMSAYSKFFEKYRKTVVSDVSNAVNNTFLTFNGTEGTKSYGMVVDLAVAYYKSEN